MLELDPNQRPTLAQVMSHPWLAPHLYRLATTLGAISTSKVSDYFGYLQGPTFDNKAKKGLFTQKRMPTHFKGPLSRLLLHSRIIHGKKARLLVLKRPNKDLSLFKGYKTTLKAKLSQKNRIFPTKY